MDIDRATARAFGFPKAAFTAVEHERRWLCHAVPQDAVIRSERIGDLYVDGSRLRLREARPIGGGPGKLRLTRKADVDSRTRLVTSIYLPEEEFALLAGALPGQRIDKLRHTLRSPADIVLPLDQFQGALEGLIVLKAEFADPGVMAAYCAPAFVVHEVTDDARYSGSHLARYGRPAA